METQDRGKVVLRGTVFLLRTVSSCMWCDENVSQPVMESVLEEGVVVQCKGCHSDFFG